MGREVKKSLLDVCTTEASDPVLGKLGPGRLGPGKLGPGRLGPGKLGPLPI